MNPDERLYGWRVKPDEHFDGWRVSRGMRVGHVARTDGDTADFVEMAPVRCAFAVKVPMKDLVDLGGCRG